LFYFFHLSRFVVNGKDLIDLLSQNVGRCGWEPKQHSEGDDGNDSDSHQGLPSSRLLRHHRRRFPD